MTTTPALDAMTLEDAAEVHDCFHKLWSAAVGEPGYVKRDWALLHSVISGALLDRFGEGWLNRARRAESAPPPSRGEDD